MLLLALVVVHDRTHLAGAVTPRSIQDGLEREGCDDEDTAVSSMTLFMVHYKDLEKLLARACSFSNHVIANNYYSQNLQSF